jgi:hypothetical protein
MARTDRDFREILVTNLISINNVLCNYDVVNDIEARNKFIQSVFFLEDLMFPYINQNKKTQYAPQLTGDIVTEAHIRLRELIRIAKTVGLTPPKVMEDVISDKIVSGENDFE